MGISSQNKLSVISGIILLTFAYAHYQKNLYKDLYLTKDDPILKELPQLELADLQNKSFNVRSLIKKNNGGLVHFWGTWCAPCQVELPSFIKLARAYEKKGVKFLLLAVNDTQQKVKKFLSRFSNLPSNIIVALDKEGTSMEQFGTLKVPETYMFDKKGRILKKFTGPQEWSHHYFAERINQHLLTNH